MEMKIIGEGLAFDDVLLVPARSRVMPADADLRTRLTRNIPLNIPLVSAPMDTVTESSMAIALAREGGIGIIHKNLSVEAQCREVDQVKRGVADAVAAATVDRRVSDACRDARGCLRVGAAIGVHEYDRADQLVAGGVDVLVVDTAHGHTDNVLETVKELRKRHNVDIVAGNVATAAAAEDLIAAGADGIKVGIGPGSICTTRVISGVGVPQLTAIMNVVAVAQAAGVPVIADGGIRYSGDITKAIAAGAHAVMCGSLLAGLDESPGSVISWNGRRFKEYRGMGSLGAMVSGSADRYSQKGESRRDKLVAEGVEGRVPYRGSLADAAYQLMGGLRAGMGYCGAPTIERLRREARFIRVSAAGVVESHPHGVFITEQAPNYAAANIVESQPDV